MTSNHVAQRVAEDNYFRLGEEAPWLDSAVSWRVGGVLGGEHDTCRFGFRW